MESSQIIQFCGFRKERTWMKLVVFVSKVLAFVTFANKNASKTVSKPTFVRMCVHVACRLVTPMQHNFLQKVSIQFLITWIYPSWLPVASYCWWFRNPARKLPGMYKTLSIMGYSPYQLARRISSINSRSGVDSSFHLICNGVCSLRYFNLNPIRVCNTSNQSLKWKKSLYTHRIHGTGIY